jgi:hypothetical protein
MWCAVPKFVNIKTECGFKRNGMTIPNSSAWITTQLDHESRFLEMYPSLGLFVMASTWLLPTFVFWQQSNAAWKKGKSRELSGAPYHRTAAHSHHTAAHTAIVQQHTDIIVQQHTAIVQQHTHIIVQQHTAIVQQHIAIVQQHTAIVQQHTDIIVQQHTHIVVQQHTDAKLFLWHSVISQNHLTNFLQSQNPARLKDQIFCPFLC